MADKLLPCPFCGGKAVYRSGGDYYSPHGWNAGCEDGHSGSPDMPTKAKAREWWNRRAALASHTSALAERDAEIARLRKALDDARRSVKNARSAIESNQVVDKDVRGTLTGVINRITAALSASPPPVAAGDWAMVPREPTPEMIGAWYRYKNGHHWPDEPPPRDTSDYGAYRAMLAAAPAQPAAEPVTWQWRHRAKREDGTSSEWSDWREGRNASLRSDIYEVEERPLYAAPVHVAADGQCCPICHEPFRPDDHCASDIELGICHAECLEGSPVVNIDTGDELPDGKVDTYLYREVMKPSPSTDQRIRSLAEQEGTE